MNKKIFADAQICLEYIILQIIYNEKEIEYIPLRKYNLELQMTTEDNYKK